MERTFVMVKPDGVKRKLVGEIIHRFEMRGIDIIAMKMLLPSRELAAKHYAVHEDKPFFDELLDFITSGPVVAMVIEGDDIIKLVRNMMGTTNPMEAIPGSIRGDFATVKRYNVVHGSDSPESSAYEIELWFPELS